MDCWIHWKNPLVVTCHCAASTLDEQRTMLRRDHTSEPIECSNADFFQTYFRFLDDTLVESIVEKLRDDNVLFENGWRDLCIGKGMRNKNKNENENENETFAPLFKVASAVAKVAESCGAKAGEFDTMGYRHFSNVRCVSKDTKIQLRRLERTANKNADNNIQPDEENEGPYSHAAHNVSVLGELYLHDTQATAEDDEKKLLFAANEIMYDDPTRGDDNAGLALLPIAHCQLNEVQEPQPFIKFLLAVTFGSQEQLGWDPTVTRLSKTVNGSNTIAYEYKIGRRTFQTIGKPISKSSAYRLVSRAT
ncbi:hypothetical protein E1B28_007141 [Marasmius oreades]|uniref:Uncharacterized protein n=1 Tax=Marasmius oreades TaxID=181124 RepID=A0A9P7S1A6_9AGAR|nr:uncharacterized protein E1B28_007141 [Marasmius oreades]KAG7093465.1 hypothetical protein E1B28_007141 [Marasmius oreades]